MDFNDLALRLERVYAAIGDKADGEIQKYVKITTVGGDPKCLNVSFDNGQSESETTNIVLAINEHLAKLKDHLKTKLGSQRQLVEDTINDSFELQLIMDLSNAEKHGYPLDRRERSNRSPRLVNIRTSVMIPPQEEIGINLRTGEVVKQGNCRIEVQAEVVNNAGELICRWPGLVDKALKEWEHFIHEHNLAT